MLEGQAQRDAELRRAQDLERELRELSRSL